jgi:Protein of unknown function (DUF2815)
MALRPLVVLGARLAFAKGLTERGTAVEGGVKKFNCKLILDKNDPQVAVIFGLLKEMAIEEWKDKGERILAGIKGGNSICIRDGNLKDWDGFAGGYYLSVTNDKDEDDRQAIKFLPAHSKTEFIRDRAEIKKVFYSGCYVNAVINLYTKAGQNPGIHGFLKAIQFSRNGESLEGGTIDTSMLPESPNESVDVDPFAETGF